MKSKELMEGDWFLFGEMRSNQGGDYDLWFVPKQIDWDFIKFTIENRWDELDWEEFTDTIPITAEILEKNGFKYGDFNNEYTTDELYYEYNYDFAIHINVDEQFELRCIDMPNLKIQYVHELQHALRLCGLNELADNFKI